ncbi:hypothetical protein F5883DRAFT_560689 [Diaporthe sp. PMI_573]|nr:hypothetical protein F5883DRAFT_560689 [Diaporthaceae sp. PMI_573]
MQRQTRPTWMELSRVERNFTCTHCSRAFRRLEHLQRHNRTHTKEKPFTCQCGASFTRNDLLKRHSRVAHPPPPTHASTVSDVGVEALFPGNSGSLAQPAFPEGHLDGAAIFEASLPDQNARDRVKRALSLPVPPEYRHAEESFCTHNGGGTLQELLQDLLEDAKSRADGPSLDRSATVASSNDTSGAVHQALSGPDFNAKCDARHATSDGSWRDSSLADMRENLVQSLLRHGRNAEPLPSTQSVSRYLHAFLDGFHQRYPVFHTRTTPLTGLPSDLIFALLAIGADSCLETKAAFYLLESVVAISPVGLGQRLNDLNVVFASHDTSSTGATPSLSGENSWLDETSHRLCIMTLLTAFALQNRSPPAMRVMWSVQGVFAHELRQSLSLCDNQEESASDHRTAWLEWARRESQRRVRHAAFCALILVSLTFDFPVAVAFGQLTVAVPCSDEEWDVPSPEEWLRVRKSTHFDPSSLSRVVEALLTGGGDISAPSSILGDFTILHAILQRIRTLRQVLPTMPQDIQTNIESGLSSLIRAHSISTYPQDLGVNALAGVAYMELHLNTGQFPSPSQDSAQLATWLQDLPFPAQSPQLFPALRCALYALNEQVSMGLGLRSCPLDIGADHQGFLSTVRLSIFLVKWLQLMAGIVHENPATEDEQRFIQSVRDVVQEATRCVELGTHFELEDLLGLSIGVLEILGHVCQRSHREHIDLVGKSFELYANMLRIQGEDLVGHME